MPTIQFFEIPADDLEPAKGFYNDLFASTIEKEEANSEGSEINICFKTADGKAKPAIGGGMTRRQHPQQMICNFITALPNYNYSSEIEQLERKIWVPKTAAKGQGYSVVRLNGENNHFGIFEEDANSK